jgi:hypothetical protein
MRESLSILTCSKCRKRFNVNDLIKDPAIKGRRCPLCDTPVCSEMYAGQAVLRQRELDREETEEKERARRSLGSEPGPFSTNKGA